VTILEDVSSGGRDTHSSPLLPDKAAPHPRTVSLLVTIYERQSILHYVRCGVEFQPCSCWKLGEWNEGGRQRWVCGVCVCVGGGGVIPWLFHLFAI